MKTISTNTICERAEDLSLDSTHSAAAAAAACCPLQPHTHFAAFAHRF